MGRTGFARALRRGAIYAVPFRWGEGVGRALIERAEASMRDSGFGKALLWVRRGNKRAASFYIGTVAWLATFPVSFPSRWASRTQRKPALPVELSGVLALRAATRYRRQYEWWHR